MRVERCWVLVVAASLAASCATGPGIADGRDVDGAWRELVTDHFVISTDVSPDSARRLAQELELERALLVAAMPALGQDGDRLPVYVFRSADEFWAVTGSRTDYIGHAYQDEWGRRSLAVRLSPQGETVEHALMLCHELAHALSLRVVPYQPRWYAEGLAQYLSSVALERKGKRAVGISPWPGVERVDPIPVRDLLAWRQEGSGGESRYYLTAWLLVRVLAAEEPEGLAALERRYAAGDSVEDGWNAAFPEYALDRPGAVDRLDRLLRTRGQDREGSPREVSATAAAAPHERLLDAAEVHTLRLAIREKWEPKERLAEAQAALRVDRGHVLALRACAELTDDPELAIELARRATHAHPNDPRAWILLADRLGRTYDHAAREAALRQAVKLAPDEPEGLLRLAEEVGVARPEEAAALVDRARELAPWSFAVQPYLAPALARVGRCDEARRAARLTSQLGGGEGTKELIAFVDQTCGPRQGRAPALTAEANLALYKGRFDVGLRLADRALALAPSGAPAAAAWTARGDALALLERADEALAAYARATELDPTHARAFRNAALALEHQGKLEEAERRRRRETELAPKDAEAWLGLGLLLARLERTDDAARALERAAELDPKGARALLAEGRTLLKAGRAKAGAAALERAVARDGGPATLNEAAWWLAGANARVDRAAGWAETSARGFAERLAAVRSGTVVASEARLGISLVGAWDTIGWVRARQGRLAEAERWLTAAERLLPNAVTAAHLGAVLDDEGRRADAADAFARAAVLDAQGPARVRLAALAGDVSVSALLARARADLRERSRLAAGTREGGAGAEGQTLELVLAADGRVAEVRSPTGEPVPAGAEALRGLPHGVRFPDAAVPSLVVKATWRCAAQRCAAVLGDDGGG